MLFKKLSFVLNYTLRECHLQTNPIKVCIPDERGYSAIIDVFKDNNTKADLTSRDAVTTKVLSPDHPSRGCFTLTLSYQMRRNTVAMFWIQSWQIFMECLSVKY